ncbi:hypothetical protein QQ045_019484 [Rhodiola kirilowii]
MKKVLEEVIESIKKNKVCLKDGLATLMGGGISSLNLQPRKEPHLFASLVNCFNLPGLPSRHEHVDIVIILENTEGSMLAWSMRFFLVLLRVSRSMKLLSVCSNSFLVCATKFYSERIAKYAFEYAYLNNRRTVTVVHKTKYNTACSLAVLGVLPGGCDQAMLWLSLFFSSFEQGASAGNVENDKLLEQKKANPFVYLLSFAMMLMHHKFPSFADRLETTVK